MTGDDSVSRIAKVAMLPLRVVQAIFAIIVLGTAAYVANYLDDIIRGLSPSELNFLIFTSVWTLLVVAYLIVVPIAFARTYANHKFAILGVEAVTTIFWFAGFIAWSVWLSDRYATGRVGGSAKAAAVFAAFEWVLFVITTVFATVHVVRTRGTHSTKPDPAVNVQEGV